jgi:proteasome lid subunit RPN8/RPN11
LGKSVLIKQVVIDSILSYAQHFHPREGILLLRGKADKHRVMVDDVLIPPLATHGYSFSNFPLHMLPTDFSIMGTAHSHPSGVLSPSVGDLNNFYGRIMVITAYPYQSEQNVAVFDREGAPIKYEIIGSSQMPVR